MLVQWYKRCATMSTWRAGEQAGQRVAGSSNQLAFHLQDPIVEFEHRQLMYPQYFKNVIPGTQNNNDLLSVASVPPVTTLGFTQGIIKSPWGSSWLRLAPQPAVAPCIG